MADTTPELTVRPSCVRTVTGWTIFFMVLLRISIGWHFAYEGLYKIVGERDWRATSYLLQSSGPLRPVFRSMVHDPDGLIRLTPESVKERIDERWSLLVQHYGLKPAEASFADELDERGKQIEAINKKVKAMADAAASMPAESDTERKASEAAMEKVRDLATYVDALAYVDRKKDGVDRRKVSEPDKPKDQVFVDAIFADEDFLRQKADYELLLEEIKEMEAELTGPVGPDYNKERLTYSYGKKAQALAALLSRAEAPLRAMEANTISKLTPEQMAKGPIPGEESQTRLIDLANMWGLTLVGACLMLGLLTRFAALGGVGLLALYYFAMPPFLGYPQSPMLEGHYLIVNKNFIEAIALLVIATSRVGRWGGLDAYLGAWVDAWLGRGRGQEGAV